MSFSLKKYLSTRTPKFHFMHKAMHEQPFNLLDVGAGNHSPSKTVRLFPHCNYYGVDLNLEYSYSDLDKKTMKGFYAKDLTELQFDDIPDNFFDYINMSHIIEHLFNGDEVIRKLTTKLKKGGYIYIEYPGARSKTLPSMHGTLNFHDDPTHVRVYNVNELKALLSKERFTVLSGGTRRSWFYILTIPINVANSFLKGEKLQAAYFWDLLGFAEYVFARKN